MTRYTDNLWGDLVREHGATLAHADRPEPRWSRRPRVIAGSTLALAVAGTALGLGLTATSATPALAVTRQADGSVLVKVNVEETTQPWVQSADRKLAAMGIDEQILINTQPGPASVSGPVNCIPWNDASKTLRLVSPGSSTPTGPPVKVLLGTNGTQVVPAGTTGAGTVHLSECWYYKSVPQSGSGNTGPG